MALDDTADLLVNRFTLNGTRCFAESIGHFFGFAGLFYCFVTAGKLFRIVSIRLFVVGANINEDFERKKNRVTQFVYSMSLHRLLICT